MIPIYVYGAGGHGKVVADIMLASGATVVGFIDDTYTIGTIVLGLPVLGNGAWLIEQTCPKLVALGIGDNAARKKVAERCLAAGLELLVAVHSSAVVARSVQLGAGTVVMANAVINPDARLGLGVIVNSAAVVEHDVVIGDYSHISPQSAMGGEARIGLLSQLGIGATILPRVSVGSSVIIGAGAVVLHDVPDGHVVAGVPARPLKR